MCDPCFLGKPPRFHGSAGKGRNKAFLAMFRRAESGAPSASIPRRGKPGRASMHGRSGLVPLTLRRLPRGEWTDRVLQHVKQWTAESLMESQVSS